MKELDGDSSGTISAPELHKMMDDMGVDLASVQNFINELDQDGDGQLSRKEIIDFLRSSGS